MFDMLNCPVVSILKVREPMNNPASVIDEILRTIREAAKASSLVSIENRTSLDEFRIQMGMNMDEIFTDGAAIPLDKPEVLPVKWPGEV